MANLLASQMVSIALINIADLVYNSLLLSTIFSMMSIFAGCMFEERVERRYFEFV